MKAKLIRRDNGEFYLIDENNKITSHHHLSKQNCNEIFGVVDVEKLVEEEFPYDFDCPLFETLGVTEKSHKSILIGMLQGTLIKGFNKAMELNEDKLFTLKDMKNFIQFLKLKYNARQFYMGKDNEDMVYEFIQSLQQPIEIEVEIEMETCSMNPLDLDCDEIIERIKLDLSECLILKKI
jgi:hypothetical protein